MTTISTFRFHIILVDDLFIKGFSGRIVHGAFLQFLREFDEEISAYLHENKTKRPYSATGMQFEKKGDQWITYFDINTFDQYLINSLIKLVIAEDQSQIFIVDRYCPIFKIEYKKTIIPEPELLPVGTTIRLRFNSTTVFSSSNRNAKTDPYPHLDVIWKQMITTYSRLVSELSTQETAILIKNLLNKVATPHFRLKSKHETLGHKIKVTGFTGTILFKIEDNTNLDLLKNILILSDVWGIGGKTTMGFGRMEAIIKLPNSQKQDHDTRQFQNSSVKSIN